VRRYLTGASAVDVVGEFDVGGGELGGSGPVAVFWLCTPRRDRRVPIILISKDGGAAQFFGPAVGGIESRDDQAGDSLGIGVSRVFGGVGA